MDADTAFEHIEWCKSYGWQRYGIRPKDVIEGVGIPWHGREYPTWQQAYLALKLVTGE